MYVEDMCQQLPVALVVNEEVTWGIRVSWGRWTTVRERLKTLSSFSHVVKKEVDVLVRPGPILTRKGCLELWMGWASAKAPW